MSEQLGSRSADDVRHFWNRKLLPILCPNQEVWLRSDDIRLLKFVVALDLAGNVNEVAVN